MPEEPAFPSRRDEARAAAKRRQTKGLDRREAVFELFVSGFSHQQIATALNASTSTVRRIVDTAVADRRLDAPERFARVQVARLSKAALARRLEARARRHPRLHALFENRRRARPLSPPRGAWVSSTACTH
jgi:DNA-binding NarL/FixJ family response regulator